MRVLYIWSAMTILVGIAQLFREQTESLVGVVFVLSGIFLAVSPLLVNIKREIVSIGYLAIATAFASRAITGLFFIELDDWHQKLFIVATWGGLAAIAFANALRIAKGITDV